MAWFISEIPWWPFAYWLYHIHCRSFEKEIVHTSLSIGPAEPEYPKVVLRIVLSFLVVTELILMCRWVEIPVFSDYKSCFSLTVNKFRSPYVTDSRFPNIERTWRVKLCRGNLRVKPLSKKLFIIYTLPWLRLNCLILFLNLACIRND